MRVPYAAQPQRKSHSPKCQAYGNPCAGCDIAVSKLAGAVTQGRKMVTSRQPARKPVIPLDKLAGVNWHALSLFFQNHKFRTCQYKSCWTEGRWQHRNIPLFL